MWSDTVTITSGLVFMSGLVLVYFLRCKPPAGFVAHSAPAGGFSPANDGSRFLHLNSGQNIEIPKRNGKFHERGYSLDDVRKHTARLVSLLEKR